MLVMLRSGRLVGKHLTLGSWSICRIREDRTVDNVLLSLHPSRASIMIMHCGNPLPIARSGFTIRVSS